MTDFSRVLLTDKMAWGLFGLAATDRLLYTSDATDNVPTATRGLARQRTLSLLVLFDKIIVHDFSEGSFRIPDLENEGVVQVIARAEAVQPVSPLRTRWKHGPLRGRGRPPVSLLRSLRLLKEETALIIDRLMSVRSDWERSIALSLGVSRRRFLGEFFAYALACVEGDDEVLRKSLLNRLPDGVLARWTAQLFDFKSNEWLMDEFTAKMVFGLAFADELRIIQELSEQLGIGVATEHYRSRYTSTQRAFEPGVMADRYVVLRSALAEERGALPRIRDIRHALALRKDPNIRSLREMLMEFNKSVQEGDLDALAEARREVARAKRIMARREQWQSGLDWVTYLSVPVGIAEALTGLIPIAGTSLSILGATGAGAVSRSKRRYRWVMFNL